MKCLNGWEWIFAGVNLDSKEPVFIAEEIRKGRTIKDILENEYTEKEVCDFLYLQIPLTRIEKRIYEQRFNIENSYQIYGSSDIYDSHHIVNSDDIRESEFVTCSSKIKNSDYIALSQDIIHSKNIYFSKNISFATYIVNSENVAWSDNIFQSKEIADSFGLFHSEKVYKGFFSGFLKNCNSCFFCFGLKDREHYIFNQRVGLQKYLEVIREFTELALVEGYWKTKIDEINFVEKIEFFEKGVASIVATPKDLGENFLNWVRGLEEFDQDIFDLICEHKAPPNT